MTSAILGTTSLDNTGVLKDVTDEEGNVVVDSGPAVCTWELPDLSIVMECEVV